mgnify:CR=1 FL=1
MNKDNSMTVKISLSERYVLIDALPKTGDYNEVKIGRSIVEKIDLTDEEIEKYKIVSTPTGNGQSNLTWLPTEELFEFNFSEIEVAFITLQFIKFNQEKTLNNARVNLYEIFVLKK